jgi:hypothetical protein
MSANWECVTRKLSLFPGDLLVIYTDGVTEAHDASGNEFGEGRLVDLIRANLALSPVQLITQIQSAVMSFSANSQFDDLTLVLARARWSSSPQPFSCSSGGHDFTAWEKNHDSLSSRAKRGICFFAKCQVENRFLTPQTPFGMTE